MKVRLLLLVCLLGVAACAVVIVARRLGNGPDEQNATPHAQNPGTSGKADGSAREDGISLERAVAIARKECEGVIRIPDDAIVETKREGGNIATTFRIPRAKRNPLSTRASWYAQIVVNAQTGEVVHWFKP